MPPLTLDGDSLGEKHKHHNKLVQDAIANKQYELRNVSDEDSDIDNLLKIDIASKTRNVDYIIQVMKSNDMLYAATAIKKSRWLITEPQYANIINPEYLHTQLLPSMNTKTFNKLMLHIRLNLKDEKRVETFYEYLKETDGAYKWLQNCSIPFIENVIKNERLIPLSLFKRLCRRSANFLADYKRVEFKSQNVVKKEMLFLLKSHTANVLNILEDKQYNYFPRIGKTKTEFVMKTCPERIYNNFEKYAYIIDLSVFATYLIKEDIKHFLEAQVYQLSQFICKFDNLKHFVKNMLEEERLEFIKQTFIDKTETSVFDCNTDCYRWYEFVPFSIALPELEKLILAENSPSKRCAMLSVLTSCAQRNPRHIKALLSFFFNRHINEPFQFKIKFVNNLLSQISTHEFDADTWKVLDQLFHSMEVYIESDHNVQMCLESIILYNVLRDEPLPDIVEQKALFCTFKTYQKRLNGQQRCKIFTYLFNSILSKVQGINIASEIDFKETIDQLKNTLTLLSDWNKLIYDYPFVLQKIQELTEIKKENKWETDLSGLYHIKKSWRKHMFEESLSLRLSEETCLNALKHNPQLLTRHDKEIETLRTNDAVTLRRLLTKLRVYWPHSLAQQWTNAYLQNLDKATGQKAVVKGLFTLLPQDEIIKLAKHHVPEDFKINWGLTDRTEITTRKNIAKHLHLARPLIPLDAVLWYAKGDYLQHALASLNAIFYNLSKVEFRKHLPNLFEGRVTMQKLGLSLVYMKSKPGELKSVFSKRLQTSKNFTIRSILFRYMHALICKVKNSSVEKELWELLSAIIDNLYYRQNGDIFRKLTQIESIPISIQIEYYMKSYTFLSSMPKNIKLDMYVDTLTRYAPHIMQSLDEEFVAEKLLSPAGPKFCTRDSEYIEVFAYYVFWSKTEEDQLRRFKRVIDPALKEAFISCRKSSLNDCYIKDNVNRLLWYFIRNFKDFTLNNKRTPAKLFTEIKLKMEKELPLLENYVFYTSWKIMTEYAKLVDQYISEIGNLWASDETETIWEEIQDAMSSIFSTKIIECLKEDTEQYFPTVSILFIDALNKMFEALSYCGKDFKLKTLEHILSDQDFIPGYVLVSRSTFNKNYLLEPFNKIRTEIRRKILTHPSKEVQMHYNNDFIGLPMEEFE